MRILAFDPSFINFGVAFGVSTPDHLEIRSAGTYKIDKLLTHIGVKGDWELSDNQRRSLVLGNITQFVLKAYKPDIVVLEDPIYNKKNPDSLITQSRCLGTLETQIGLYFLNKRTYTVTNFKPNVIKLGVGVAKGDFKDKDAVTERLNKLVEAGELRYLDSKMVPTEVDDHANDAVAMVYTKHKEVRDVLD